MIATSTSRYWPGRVLSLDPGLRRCGAVVVDTNGMEHECVRADVLQTESRASKFNQDSADDRVRRVREFAGWLSVLLDTDPGVVAAEAMSFPRSHAAVVSISLVWGALVSEVDRRRIPLVHVAPIVWRKDLVPGGDEQESWRRALRTVPSFVDRSRHIVRDDQEHVLDALGVFCWAVRRDIVRASMRGRR